MTSQYRGATVDRAWVGVSERAQPLMHSAIAVVEKDTRYEVTVPLGSFDPRDVQVELSDGLLTVSAKRRVGPSEDFDDMYSPERSTSPTYHIFLGRDIDEATLSALCLRDALLVSAKRSRTHA